MASLQDLFANNLVYQDDRISVTQRGNTLVKSYLIYDNRTGQTYGMATANEIDWATWEPPEAPEEVSDG